MNHSDEYPQRRMTMMNVLILLSNIAVAYKYTILPFLNGKDITNNCYPAGL